MGYRLKLPCPFCGYHKLWKSDKKIIKCQRCKRVVLRERLESPVARVFSGRDIGEGFVGRERGYLYLLDEKLKNDLLRDVKYATGRSFKPITEKSYRTLPDGIGNIEGLRKKLHKKGWETEYNKEEGSLSIFRKDGRGVVLHTPIDPLSLGLSILAGATTGLITFSGRDYFSRLEKLHFTCDKCRHEWSGRAIDVSRYDQKKRIVCPRCGGADIGIVEENIWRKRKKM